jgi:hypothetical protein
MALCDLFHQKKRALGPYSTDMRECVTAIGVERPFLIFGVMWINFGEKAPN